MRFIILLFVALSACAPVMDVRLQAVATLQDGSESCRGETHGAAYGDGVVSLSCDQGETCVGTYGHRADRSGYGSFQCSDGRTGTFTFLTTGFRATGEGEIAGEPFDITVSRFAR